MVERCIQYQPWWLLPCKRTGSTGKEITFNSNNSGISIQWGNQVNGIGRGTTPSCVHLSEVSSFDNPDQLIDAGLMKAIHETPDTFVVFESTGAGFNYWWKKWKEAKHGWPRGTSRFYPMFLPWFVGTDLYPTESWLRKQPIPGDWTPTDLTIAHAERSAAYVKVNPLLTKWLSSNWTMPREQLWYYEVNYQEHKKARTLNIFLSEMPADDFEAFQNTNLSAFDQDVIIVHRNETGRRNPVGVYGVMANQTDVPVKMQPVATEIDTSRPRIKIKSDWTTAAANFDAELVPLKFYGYSDTDPTAKLFIFEEPQDDDEYGLGIDTGEGIGKDSSVGEVVRKGTLDRSPAQVAEWASPHINAFNLWPIAMTIATLYSPRRRQCRAVIECKGNGAVVQVEMRKRGWMHFHRHQRYDRQNLDTGEDALLGFHTDVYQRSILMDMLMAGVNDFWLEIHSPYFVEEMEFLSRDERKQSYRADIGGHDDRIMALGMPFVSLHIKDYLSMKARKPSDLLTRLRGKADAEPDPVYKPMASFAPVATMKKAAMTITRRGRSRRGFIG